MPNSAIYNKTMPSTTSTRWNDSAKNYVSEDNEKTIAAEKYVCSSSVTNHVSIYTMGTILFGGMFSSRKDITHSWTSRSCAASVLSGWLRSPATAG